MFNKLLSLFFIDWGYFMVFVLENYWLGLVIIGLVVLYRFLTQGDNLESKNIENLNNGNVASPLYIEEARVYAVSRGWKKQFEKLLSLIIEECQGDVRVGHIQWIFKCIDSNDLKPKIIPHFSNPK